jgi:hypothetical protein
MRPEDTHPALAYLEHLRPGESYTYYKGNYEADMARSRKEAPTYARQLQGLFLEVILLRRAGKITVHTVPRNTAKKAREYDYIATRL